MSGRRISALVSGGRQVTTLRLRSPSGNARILTAGRQWRSLSTSPSATTAASATKCPRPSSSSSSSQHRQRRWQQQREEAHERNLRIGAYAAAVAIGALGATYASVPLYKLFCQATGFGGTTQRVSWDDVDTSEDGSWAAVRRTSGGGGGGGGASAQFMERMYELSNVASMAVGDAMGGPGTHANTWTDEDAAAKLANLKPVENGRLIRVTFDSTIGDVLPWSFVPAQGSIRVVPGETALCFFTTTNRSSKAITGVATYNVYPLKAGLYFNKIQCFCFEEQRLLPGETVDMPVFFFIDPEYENDAALKRCNNITLSYTFFQTDMDDDFDKDDDDHDMAEEKTA